MVPVTWGLLLNYTFSGCALGSFPHRALTDGMLQRAKGRMLHPHGFVAFGWKGLGFLNQGKTQFINISLHKEGGLFVFKGSRQIGFSLSWPSCAIALLLLHLQKGLTGSLLPPAHFHGSRSPWPAQAKQPRVDELRGRDRRGWEQEQEWSLSLGLAVRNCINSIKCIPWFQAPGSCK